MDKKELYDSLDDFSLHLLKTMSQVDQIKSELKMIVEENTRLRLENDKLRARLNQVSHPSRKQEESTNPLREIYQDGFHICTDFYGQRLDPEGTCMMCTELLYR